MSLKVNLLWDSPDDVRNGYVNFDEHAPIPDQAGRIKASVQNLDHFVEAGEADEIVSNDILNYLSADEGDAALTNWLSKLAHGGKLCVSVVDVREVSKKCLANVITIEDTNVLLHGDQEKPHRFRKTSFTLPLLIEVFTNRGFKVLTKRIQNSRAVIVVERP